MICCRAARAFGQMANGKWQMDVNQESDSIVLIKRVIQFLIGHESVWICVELQRIMSGKSKMKQRVE